MGPTPSRRIIAEPIEADPVTPAPPADAAADSAGAWQALAIDFPDLIRDHVDLVEELESILRGDFGTDDPAAPDEDAGEERTAAAEPADTNAPPWVGAEPEAGALAFPDETDDAFVEPRPVAEAWLALDQRAAELIETPEPEPEPGFWKVDETAWTAAPAWREPRRTRRTDIVIIGGLVLLIAGGGAYSAFRVRADDGLTGRSAATTVADAASRAEAGIGAPFSAVRSLRADDPTATTPSLAAAITGAQVDPLPAMVEPPVEATVEPIFTAAIEAPEVGGNGGIGGMGGPFVPLNPQTFVLPASPAPPPASPAATATAGMTTTVTTWVNMRAGPDNSAAVVTVVSPDAIVTVGACDYWCGVTVNGQTGFIFKDFLVAHP